MKETFFFKNRPLVAPLKIIAMDNCAELVKKADQHIVSLRKDYLVDNAADDPTVLTREYDKESYLTKIKCPRFGSGEGKGTIEESVRGCDVFIISDVTNNSMSFPMYGKPHYYSPDDHYQDLKRIVAACMSSAERVSVIMPFLYESRQHKRTNRESLDCAMALEELSDMGVSNIITFDAHDPRVQNAIPLHDFDNYSPVYQMLKALERKFGGFHYTKDDMIIISPDEGAMSRAVYLANILGVNMGMFYKRRDYTKVVNGKNPIVAHEYLGPDVEGKTVMILDDMISTGESMLDTARDLKGRKAKDVIICCTFGLFTNGFAKFDEAYEKGWFNYIVTTNLNYRNPEIFEKPWYIEADLSMYIGKIINTMNHNVAVTTVITPTERIQKLMARNGIRKENK